MTGSERSSITFLANTKAHTSAAFVGEVPDPFGQHALLCRAFHGYIQPDKIGVEPTYIDEI